MAKPLPSPAAPASGSDPLFNYGLVSSDGVIYEDNFIQIGHQSHFYKHQGRFVLYYGNFTTGPLQNLQTSIALTKELSANQQRPPAVVEPRKQEQQLIDITCLSEFVDPPLVKIDYTVGGRGFSQTIKLPVSVVKFVQPYRVTEQEFLKLWGETPNEKQQIVDTAAPSNVAYCIQIFTEGFHLAVIPGTSWSVNNVVGCGLFYSQSSNLPVLVRMEISPTTSLYRITVRTPSPTLSHGLLSTLALILGKPTTV